MAEDLDIARPEGASFTKYLLGSEEDGNPFRLEDSRMGGKGVFAQVSEDTSFRG